MNLADKITEYRKQNNMTQQEFAEKGGLTRAAVAAIESERIENPGMDTLIGIARAMDTSIDELVKE